MPTVNFYYIKKNPQSENRRGKNVPNFVYHFELRKERRNMHGIFFSIMPIF